MAHSFPPTSNTPASPPRTDECMGVSSSEIPVIPWSTEHEDYTIDIKKMLGRGRWSVVWAADHMESLYSPNANPNKGTSHDTGAPWDLALTPPSSPIRTSSVNEGGVQAIPEGLQSNLSWEFAVKVPADRSSKKIVHGEAKILSYLTGLPDHEQHIVPFHGFDARNGSVVLTAIPHSLESERLYVDPEGSKDKTLSNIAFAFPRLAMRLVEGLEWIHNAGIVHADIKPENILITTPNFPDPVYADFSAAFTQADEPGRQAGGQTWEFMAPELCYTSADAKPNQASDVYALAMTMLHFLAGGSPFAKAPNKALMIDMVKKGKPIEYIMEIPEAAERLRTLRNMLIHEHGLDIYEFLSMALKKGPEQRPTARGWKDWLNGKLQNPVRERKDSTA